MQAARWWRLCGHFNQLQESCERGALEEIQDCCLQCGIDAALLAPVRF